MYMICIQMRRVQKWKQKKILTFRHKQEVRSETSLNGIVDVDDDKIKGESERCLNERE